MEKTCSKRIRNAYSKALAVVSFFSEMASQNLNIPKNMSF